MTLIKVTSVVDIDTHKAYIHAKHVSVPVTIGVLSKMAE